MNKKVAELHLNLKKNWITQKQLDLTKLLYNWRMHDCKSKGYIVEGGNN